MSNEREAIELLNDEFAEGELKLRSRIEKLTAGLQKADIFRIIEGRRTVAKVGWWRCLKIRFYWIIHEESYLSEAEADQLRAERRLFLKELTTS